VIQYEGAHPRFFFDGAKIGIFQNFNTQVTGNSREIFSVLTYADMPHRFVNGGKVKGLEMKTN
jgi:hypothetical protein